MGRVVGLNHVHEAREVDGTLGTLWGKNRKMEEGRWYAARILDKTLE